MQNDFPQAKAPLRVALLVEDGRDMHESTRFAIRKVGALLQDAGYEVEEISPPMLEVLFGMWLRLGALDVQLGLVPQLELLNDSGLTQAIQGMLPSFPPPTPQVMMQALADRDLLFRAWNVFLEQYTLLFMPVLT
jgi:amidase